MSTEQQQQIEGFLNDLEIAYFEKGETDFSYLYEKYPLARLGIRRSLFFLTKRRQARQLKEHWCSEKEEFCRCEHNGEAQKELMEIIRKEMEET